MSGEADDQGPVTRRELPVTSPQLAFVVDITYREPSYALYSGTEKAYAGTFQVWAADERAAIAEARSGFEAASRTSGVGWARVITGIVCRPR